CAGPAGRSRARRLYAGRPGRRRGAGRSVRRGRDRLGSHERGAARRGIARCGDPDGGGPRATVLLDLVRRAAPKSGQLAVADAVLAEMRQKSLPEPNIDIAIATLAQVAGMVRGAGEAIFAVARTAGWIAHALEAYAGAGPLRPRA